MKYTLMMLSALWAVDCSAHDAPYYHLHPKELQKAILACNAKQAKGISCEQLNRVASNVNELAYQLRLDPQAYGQHILSLQQRIAKLESEATPDLAALADHKFELEQRIAIVKWLESPSG